MEETTQILLALNDIRSSVSEEQISNITIALIAALAAIAGSLVTALFQHINLKHSNKSALDKLNFQLKAEIISKQRQEWMDSVRDSAANLLAEYDHVYGLIIDHGTDNQPRITELHLSTSRKAILIRLKLNPNKPVQKDVIDAIDSMAMLFHYASFKKDENHDHQYDLLRKKYLNSLNILFEETWGSIKRLE